MLTGHPDTNLIALSSLPLRNLKQVCQTNQYYNNLCRHDIIKYKLTMAKGKVETAIKILDNRILRLQTTDHLSFINYRQLLDYIGLTDINIDDEDYYPGMMDNIVIDNITRDKLYTVLFESSIDELSYSYLGTKLQIKDLLLHLYYDNMIYKID